MTMLQTYSHEQPAFHTDNDRAFDLGYFRGLLKRRKLYFAIPFLLVVMVGSGIVAIQRPIFRAEGKILVESPEIPADLVRPTVTEVADERIQVIQQRIMARDNLLAIVNKYDLFPRERQWMSGTELLDLMRDRMEIKPLALDTPSYGRPNNAIAFTLTFEYEVPALAMKVANEFLTSILSEDASTRTNNASETTKFLEREVKRLEGERDAVVERIEAIKQQPRGKKQSAAEESKARIKTLADLEEQLVHKSAIYSDEYPDVKSLRKQIAALRTVINAEPQDAAATDDTASNGVAAIVLTQQQANLESSLDEANRKLTAARLGESMERGQQAERLQVIEQPALPQIPVRPKRLKWFAIAFGLAAMIGAGCVLLAEILDGSIRGSRELAAVVDRHLIVSIPYLSSPGEQRRKRRNFVLLCAAVIAVFAAVITMAVMKGISVDFFWFDRSWIDAATRLLH
jgi:uncharacterized protein involved in exopolysaccharide biosynthesis